MANISPSIVITGVSTGIGLGCAAEFVRRGYTVFGSVRKQADADRLQTQLGERFIPLLFDVTDQAAVDAAVVQVGAALQGKGLDGLINNSGIAEGGPLQHIPLDSVRRQFEVNVFGLLRVTQAFLPLLGAKENHPSKPGKILNISSVGGKFAAPFIGPYAATKHAVEALSQALRRELLMYGIDVIIIGPGAVASEIWDKGERSAEPFRDTAYYPSMLLFKKNFLDPGKQGLSLESIGKSIADIFENPRPKTRYAILKDKFKNWTIPRLLPDRVVDRFVGKANGLLKK